MAKGKNDLVAGVLSYMRINNASDGYFYQTTWDEDEVEPLIVQSKSIRGPMESLPKKDTEEKIKEEALKPNLQTVDFCSLDKKYDTLKIDYFMQVAGTPTPYNCSNPEVRRILEDVHKDFIVNDVYDELAFRLATNIANGRFLWRNRSGCSKIEVSVHFEGGEEYRFNAFDVPFDSFFPEKYNEADLEKIKEISAQISAVYKGDKPFVNFKVSAKMLKINGMEVYPSQEIPGNNQTSKSKKGEKTKFLYKLENNQAGFHPQKITNALLCFDNWYEDAKYPISINAFGSIAQEGIAFRGNKENSFYALWDKVRVAKYNDDQQKLNDILDKGNQCYLAAMFLRGGVFSESTKKDEG